VRLCTIWPGDHPAGLHPGRRGNGSGCASPSAPLAQLLPAGRHTRCRRRSGHEQRQPSRRRAGRASAAGPT
jgi:hypothetical protein